MLKSVFCMNCGASMPATAAFCRQCGTAVPEEDLAQSKKELEAQAAAVADALAELSSGPKDLATPSKSSFNASMGAGAPSLKDRHQLEALGVPGNLKWAALALLLIAGAALGGWSVYKYVGHDDSHDTHEEAAKDSHKADHPEAKKHGPQDEHKGDHPGDHKDEAKGDHKGDHKGEAKDAHAPAAKPSH